MAGAGPLDLHNIKQIDKLTKAELIRACRLAIAAEFDATNLYEMIAEQSESAITRDIFQEIANEEKVHAGEFIKLLSLLNPEEVIKHHARGAQEVSRHTASVEVVDLKIPNSEKPQVGDIPGFIADIRPRSVAFEEIIAEEMKNIDQEIDEAIAEELKE